MRYDIIVAGLGPGGATAAHELSRAGFNVLAIDKKTFPRYKPCGGGLSARIHKLLSPDFQSTVERTIKGIRFLYPGRGDFALHTQEPIAYMVTRERFDHFLVQKAKSTGVESRENETILNIEEGPENVKVTTDAGQYQAKVMIGADGAHSLAARVLNPKFARRKILALEEEILQGNVQPSLVSDEVIIDLGSAPGGYAWSFPKSARLSIGIAGFTGQKKSLLQQFSTFKARQCIGSSLSGKPLMGHPLPLFEPRQFRLASSRILLVGDAANLVDPLLGEGIYYAIRSSQIAADTVVKVFRQGAINCTLYQACIQQEIYPEFRAAQKLARLSYAFPQLWYEAMRKYPEVTRRFYEILQGLESYPGFLSKLKSELGKFLKNIFFRGL
jgi:geranylgeranyl reductase family protein